jgi:hypothetical protein
MHVIKEHIQEAQKKIDLMEDYEQIVDFIEREEIKNPKHIETLVNILSKCHNLSSSYVKEEMAVYALLHIKNMCKARINETQSQLDDYLRSIF